MVPPARRFLSESLPGVLMALLAAWGIAPRAAYAGCNYPAPIWHNGEPTPMPAGLAGAAEHPHPSSPGPCRGPGCSRQPAPAPLPPTTTSPPPIDLWASLDRSSPLLTPPPHAHRGASEPSDPVRRAATIYHPPR